jgi:tetratricopeptide (TPR) repeat protein
MTLISESEYNMSQLYFCLVTAILLTELGLAIDVPFVFGENSSDLSSYTSNHLKEVSSLYPNLAGVSPVSSPNEYETVEIAYSINKSINQSSRDNNIIESQDILSSLIPLNPDTSNVINISTEVPPIFLWPNSPEYFDAKDYLTTGNWYYNEPSKDYANALICYEEGIKLRPNDTSLIADLWYGKGNALLKLGKYNDSLAAYDMSLSFKPNYRNAWDAKCRILKDLHYDSSYACSRANASI